MQCDKKVSHGLLLLDKMPFFPHLCSDPQRMEFSKIQPEMPVCHTAFMEDVHFCIL